MKTIIQILTILILIPTLTACSDSESSNTKAVTPQNCVPGTTNCATNVDRNASLTGNFYIESGSRNDYLNVLDNQRLCNFSTNNIPDVISIALDKGLNDDWKKGLAIGIYIKAKECENIQSKGIITLETSNNGRTRLFLEGRSEANYFTQFLSFLRPEFTKNIKEEFTFLYIDNAKFYEVKDSTTQHQYEIIGSSSSSRNFEIYADGNPNKDNLLDITVYYQGNLFLSTTIYR